MADDSAPRLTLSRRATIRGLGAASLGTLLATASTGGAAANGIPDPTRDRTAITFDQFVGVNAFVDDPISRLFVAGCVREYHNWYWDEGDGDEDYPGYPNNEIAWAPSYVRGDDWDWNFDLFYDILESEGLEVAPCIQRAPGWLREDGDHYREDVPTDEAGADSTDPQSYEAKAHHAFQFAARYGRTQVDEELLTLRDDQPVETGLGYVRYFEDWNEPNQWWEGEDAEFSPDEYAAMSSAAYDGHAGTLEGPTGTYGVKNADPSMQYVMGGIAGHSLEWIEALEEWYSEHRPDGEFVPDVLNVHHYAHDENSDGGPALSPEEDDFRGRMAELAEWRDEHHPQVELWVSEFGWDTHPESVLRPPLVGDFDRQEMQAIWLVRAYLAFAAAGVDRAQMFMLRDVDPDDATQYSTCGLVTQKGEWEPKPSWYYVSSMRNALSGARFDREVESGREDVRIYAFESYWGTDAVYAIWCPTADDVTVSGYELGLPEDALEATLVELEDGETRGVASSLAIEDSAVTVDVSERPVFVQVERPGRDPCESFDAADGAVLENGDWVCDLDGDGNYRDLTVSGDTTTRDLQHFFERQHRDPYDSRPDLFDYTGNGDVGQPDVVDLFHEI